jgi:hypothetical protein
MKVIGDPMTWPKWQSEIIETVGDAPLGEGDRVEGRAKMLGFEVNGLSTAVTATPMAFVEDVIVGVHMRIEYTIDQTPSGTVVTRRLIATLPSGISGRILAFFLKRRLRAMQEGVLDALVAQAEVG